MKQTYILIAAAALCFMASCFLPVVSLQANDAIPSGATLPGYYFLIIGWLGLLGLQFGWYANLSVLLAIVLLLFKQPLSARIASIVAVLLGCDSFFLGGMLYPSEGTYSYVKNWEAGIYVWMLSILIVAVASFLAKGKNKAALVPEEYRQSILNVDRTERDD